MFIENNFTVVGRGGETVMTELKSRAISESPLTAAQIKRPALQEWTSLGFLANLVPSIANGMATTSYVESDSGYQLIFGNCLKLNRIRINQLKSIFR